MRSTDIPISMWISSLVIHELSTTEFRITRGISCVFPTIHIPTGAASFLYHAYVWIRTDPARQEKRITKEHVCPFLKSLSCAMVLVAGVSVPDLSGIILRNALCNHLSGCIPPVNQEQNQDQHQTAPLAPAPPAGGCSCSSRLCSSCCRPTSPGKENDLPRRRRRERRRSSTKTRHGALLFHRPVQFPRCRQPHSHPLPLSLAARLPLPLRKVRPLRRAAANWHRHGQGYEHGCASRCSGYWKGAKALLPRRLRGGDMGNNRSPPACPPPSRPTRSQNCFRASGIPWLCWRPSKAHPTPRFLALLPPYLLRWYLRPWGACRARFPLPRLSRY